jgi:hypothetical protein
MKNTFQNKVMAERAVLSVVNKYTSGDEQLGGLSWVAIDAWQHSGGRVATSVAVQELKEISDLCQRLSDRSHETFGSLDDSLAEVIDARIRSLDQILSVITS